MTSITVLWNQINCPATEYKIKYDGMNQLTNLTEITLENLKPCSHYDISVTAKINVNEGPSNNITGTTGKNIKFNLFIFCLFFDIGYFP